MQLNLLLAPTLRQATKEVIKSVQISQNLDLRNFIVVPDRFSLQAEKLLFSELGITSTFNIDVVSISKLANLVLKLAGNNFKSQSNLEGSLVVYKILLEHKNEFESLKDANITLDFAKEIFLTISQLKSSEVDCENFLNKTSKLNFEKLIDIAKIYKLYEEENREKVDAADLLVLFEKEIENCELIKNSNFYFAEFDSFTAQVKTILKLLIKSAKSVAIGACFSNSNENSYIYEKDVIQKVEQICEDLKLKPNINYCQNSNNDFQNHIAHNLFAFKQIKKDIPFGVAILSNANLTTEIEKVANIIKFEIAQNGYQFKDFNIIVPSLESYSKQIQEIFSNEDISYYIDETKTLSQLAPIKFINKVLEYLKEENLNNFLSLINDNFCSLANEEIKSVYKEIFERGVDFNKCLDNQNSFKIKLYSLKEKYQKINNFSQFIEFLNEISSIFEIENKVEELINNFKQNDDLLNEKIYQQYQLKYSQALEQLSKLNLECDLSKDDMQNIANEMFESIIISNLPLSINSVFVGQSDVSFFEERKISIFLGSENLPISLKDSGLILDSDIEKLESIKIEPSVEMINRRSKFKLFNDACLSKEKVYISYISNGNVNSAFIKSFKNMWTISGKELPISDDFYEKNVEDFDLLSQSLVFKSFLNCKREEILKFLNNAKKNEIITKEYIENIKDVLYSNKSTSVSKIQQFFNCPFAHFANYGLKLQPNEVAQVLPADVGNLFHAFAEKFLLSQNKKVDFKTLVDECFYYAKNSNDRLKLLSNIPEHIAYFNYLNKQAINFASTLIKQIENCGYIPVEFEKKFTIKTDKILGDEYSIVGRIDRIDKSENSYRLIDYKTGEAKVSLSKLYEGRQIQLPIYILSLEESKVDGAFYFPVFDSISNKDNKLNGFFENDTCIIKKLDKTLSTDKLKSDLIDLTLSKTSTNVEFKVYSRAGVLQKGNLQKIALYAKKLVESGIEESLSGKINALPIETRFCEVCPYYELCKFNIEFGEFRESVTAVKENNLVEIVENS